MELPSLKFTFKVTIFLDEHSVLHLEIKLVLHTHKKINTIGEQCKVTK